MIELIRIGSTVSLTGLLAPLGVGWLWQRALVRDEPRLTLGMIYWLGLISLGTLVLLGHALRLPQTLVFSLVALVPLAGWIASFRRPRVGIDGCVRTAWPLLPLALVGIGYCILDPVRVWDAYLIWLARVRLLEQWIPLSRFRDLGIVYPAYPFLGPAAWWWVDGAARVPVEAGRVIFLFAYLAFFLAVITAERQEGSIHFRWLWVFLAYAGFSLQIIDGFQDGFLMVSTGMVALAFAQWGDRGAGWILPLAAALSLIKAEGGVIGLILVFCWFVSNPSAALRGDRAQQKAWLLGALGFASITGAWLWLQIRNGLDPFAVQGQDIFRMFAMEDIVRQADRIPKILWEVGRQYTWNYWISIPFLAALISVAAGREHLKRRHRFLLGFLTVHLLFVITVFWVTQQPFEWHLGTALHRLLMQSRLVMLLFVFETAIHQWAPVLDESSLLCK
jgi:hypothetical protein